MNVPIPRRQVHVVDDDVAVRRSISLLLDPRGIGAVEWACPWAFLRSARLVPPTCVILDVRMPGMTGPEVQDELRRRKNPVPIVFLTAHADVPTTVRAMQGGAADFLLKPVDPAALLDVVQRALLRSAAEAAATHRARALRRRFAGLTPREREVFDQVVRGASNKVSAGALGITENTLKVHRSRVMEKMGSTTLADLVRMAVALGVLPADTAE
ncbi:MAG: response regulator [Deltaproteobacteria bacterium]